MFHLLHYPPLLFPVHHFRYHNMFQFLFSHPMAKIYVHKLFYSLRTYSPNPQINQGNGNSAPTVNKGFRPRLPSAPSTSAPGVMGLQDSGKRTPSPFAGMQAPIRPPQRQRGSNIYRVPTPVEIGDPSSDYFHPDFRLAMDSYVELIVSNLDYNISPLDWRKVIFATFQPHVKVSPGHIKF